MSDNHTFTVVLSGGGTAGHINPALAVAEELQARGYEVLFAGTPDRLESRLVPEAGIPYKSFNVHGFNRRKPMTLVTGIMSILVATGEAKKWLLENNVDAVVGFGGYVSMPVARAAEKLHIPVFACEQNSLMGMSNKYVARKAHAVCLTYEDTIGTGDIQQRRLRVTGNPVRRAITEKTRTEGREYIGVPDTQDDIVLVITGGSLGAKHINESLANAKEELLSIDGLHIIHITGEKTYDETCKMLALTDDEKKRYDVRKYEKDMASCLAAADLVISRAGASTLAEIAAVGVPSVLVPYPYATEDHQTKNAQSFVTIGGAIMVVDDECDDRLANTVIELLEDRDRLGAMRDAIASDNKKDSKSAAEKVVDIIEEVTR